MQDLLDEMLKEEEDSLEENRQILSDLMKCRQTLQEELSVTIEVPFDVDLMKPNIFKQVQKLTAIMKEYETIKMKRLQKLVEYKDTVSMALIMKISPFCDSGCNRSFFVPCRKNVCATS